MRLVVMGRTMGMGVKCCRGNGGNDVTGMRGTGNSKSFPHSGVGEPGVQAVQ